MRPLRDPNPQLAYGIWTLVTANSTAGSAAVLKHCLRMPSYLVRRQICL